MEYNFQKIEKNGKPNGIKKELLMQKIIIL